MLYSAAAVKPSCWSVLPQGSQFNVLAAVEDKLYILDPFEAVQQASICKGFRIRSAHSGVFSPEFLIEHNSVFSASEKLNEAC